MSHEQPLQNAFSLNLGYDRCASCPRGRAGLEISRVWEDMGEEKVISEKQLDRRGSVLGPLAGLDHRWTRDVKSGTKVLLRLRLGSVRNPFGPRAPLSA